MSCIEARPIELPLDTKHPCAHLVIAADLTTGNEACGCVASEVQSRGSGKLLVMHKCAAGVGAEIAAGPTQWSPHRRLGVDRRWRRTTEISGGCCRQPHAQSGSERCNDETMHTKTPSIYGARTPACPKRNSKLRVSGIPLLGEMFRRKDRLSTGVL